MRISLPPPAPCPECGSDSVYHRAQYIALLLETGMAPIVRALDGIRVGVRLIGRRKHSTGALYKTLGSLRLGEFEDAPDDKTLLLDQVLWDEARSRGIAMREFRLLGLPSASFVATFPDGRTISFESIPFPPSMPESAWWIDDKPVMKEKFEAAGIPVARGGTAYTKAGALKIFNRIDRPVIAKPAHGSGSRHTTTHISTQEELLRAFAIAKQVSPGVVIEEELMGAVYRPTLVGGKLIATIRRDQPQVVGDGTHTVAELIEKENEHPKRQGPYFSKIVMTPAHWRELERQNLTLESVPAKGRVVKLHQKINWSVGGTTTDVTDIVHPDNKALFEEMARILHAPIVGIDFIIDDISKSWKEQQKCGAIECNGRPFFDNHHLPFYGEPRNVARVIWDLNEN
ncbi:MAG TPA: hypothetical protein VG934_03585 [Candidatus Paceibacterota bacterium]|nr:hypothetical protein [Candidatus Paceibacterota bacterium]